MTKLILRYMNKRHELKNFVENKIFFSLQNYAQVKNKIINK